MAAQDDSNDNNKVIKRIKILIISDIHLNTHNIAKIGEYIASSKIKIDHLWAPGDFMSLKEADNDDEKKLNQAENNLIDLLQSLRKIHPKPIIIAGNHDPITLFSTDNEKYVHFGECVNIHKQLYRVEGEDNLFMAGFGGSGPAMCESQVKWKGYPFKDDEEFGKEFNPFMKNSVIKNKEQIKTDKSIVLFTHVGPSMSSTAMDWRNMDKDKVIYTGSDHVTNAVLNKELRDTWICNIHGHAHLGVGQARIGGVKIINPGSCSGKLDGDVDPCNNFAILDLTQFKDKTIYKNVIQFARFSKMRCNTHHR
eukprot:27485_1